MKELPEFEKLVEQIKLPEAAVIQNNNNNDNQQTETDRPQ
jgi:hypothetical protein